MRPFIIQENSFNQKDKVKTTLKDKSKKFILVLRESDVEAEKIIVYAFQGFYVFNRPYFESQ